MTVFQGVPKKIYGVLRQNHAADAVSTAVEQVSQLGYAVLAGEYDAPELKSLSDAFDLAHARYVACYGLERLRKLDEANTMRALLVHGGEQFLKLALNPVLQTALRRLIAGTFVLNQQNGILNPSHQTYNQGAWHRDLPYQHFVSSRPLAINALFCVDDFTEENGATFVLPASHKSEEFPSESYVEKNAVQVFAKAGSFLLLDCMVFHSGGPNLSEKPRRGINHVFNIPYFKQQIHLPRNLESGILTEAEKAVLGFGTEEPGSIETYLARRQNKVTVLQ